METTLAASLGLVGVILAWRLSDISTNLKLLSEQTHSLRLAALERRLDAHQRLYALWAEFKDSLHSDENRGRAETELRKWWNTNCLYVAPAVREEFKDCLAESCQFPGWRDRGERKAVEYRRRVLKMFELIEKGVDLPPIGCIPEEHAEQR